MPESPAAAPAVKTPTRRPLERFWPYVDLAEAPSADELAALDPDLHAALFGPRDLPFSFTLVFPDFEGEACARAIALAEQAPEYRAVGDGSARRHRARFFGGDGVALRELYAVIGDVPESQVLVDDRPVPFARELWLPLLYLQLLR
jgi:hypothetical protein